jgi:hypothetical protein
MDILILYSKFRSQKNGWFMVFNATFNNISVISWQSVLLVEETRVPGENHRPVASHWMTPANITEREDFFANMVCIKIYDFFF